MPRYRPQPDQDAIDHNASEAEHVKYWRGRMIALCDEIRWRYGMAYQVLECHAWPTGYLITLARKRTTTRSQKTLYVRDRADFEREVKGTV